MKKKILIVLFLLGACGYQPIHINKEDTYFKKITLLGEREINRKIISLMNIKKDPSTIKNSEIIFTSSTNTLTTSKDSRGRDKTFRTTVTIKLTQLIDEKVIKERTFTESFSYQNIDNKYDLFIYQNNIEDNLVNKIIDNLNIFLKT